MIVKLTEEGVSPSKLFISKNTRQTSRITSKIHFYSSSAFITTKCHIIPTKLQIMLRTISQSPNCARGRALATCSGNFAYLDKLYPTLSLQQARQPNFYSNNSRLISGNLVNLKFSLCYSHFHVGSSETEFSARYPSATLDPQLSHLMFMVLGQTDS